MKIRTEESKNNGIKVSKKTKRKFWKERKFLFAITALTTALGIESIYFGKYSNEIEEKRRSPASGEMIETPDTLPDYGPIMQKIKSGNADQGELINILRSGAMAIVVELFKKQNLATLLITEKIIISFPGIQEKFPGKINITNIQRNGENGLLIEFGASVEINGILLIFGFQIERNLSLEEREIYKKYEASKERIEFEKSIQKIKKYLAPEQERMTTVPPDIKIIDDGSEKSENSEDFLVLTIKTGAENEAYREGTIFSWKHKSAEIIFGEKRILLNVDYSDPDQLNLVKIAIPRRLLESPNRLEQKFSISGMAEIKDPKKEVIIGIGLPFEKFEK